MRISPLSRSARLWRGTDRDLTALMKSLNRIALFGGLWASTACGQSVDKAAAARAGEVNLGQASP
ncbi:MAG: hypothetical protein M3Z10_04585, partial [Gemmatimonadota bacterium]|nr:hypothetical protein [Gemmatimonadota bacterium]